MSNPLSGAMNEAGRGRSQLDTSLETASDSLFHVGIVGSSFPVLGLRFEEEGILVHLAAPSGKKTSRG